jgi:2'-5' RNA ligase
MSASTPPEEVMVAVLPPAEVWPQYVDIKQRHLKPSLIKKGRKAFPHITLAQIKKNTQSMDEICTSLRQHLVELESFSVTLDGLDSFDYAKSSCIYVPVTPRALPKITAMYKAVKSSGLKVEDSFVPHVGLGNVDKHRLEVSMEEYKTKIHPASFSVEHAVVLSRGSRGPWCVVASIPLAQCEAKQSNFKIGQSMDLREIERLSKQKKGETGTTAAIEAGGGIAAAVEYE